MEEPGAEPDPLNGAKSIRELYELASSNYVGKYTVPVCILSIELYFIFFLSVYSTSDLPFTLSYLAGSVG